MILIGEAVKRSSQLDGLGPFSLHNGGLEQIKTGNVIVVAIR